MTTRVLVQATLQRMSFAIACEKFSGTYSYDAIDEKLQEIAEELGLNRSKVI